MLPVRTRTYTLAVRWLELARENSRASAEVHANTIRPFYFISSFSSPFTLPFLKLGNSIRSEAVKTNFPDFWSKNFGRVDFKRILAFD